MGWDHLTASDHVRPTQRSMRTIVTILLGAVAAVVVLWLALIVCLAILRPGLATLRESARIVPDAIRLITRLKPRSIIESSSAFAAGAAARVPSDSDRSHS
jgi:hypothetical protein